MFNIRLKVVCLFVVGFIIGFLAAFFISVIQHKNKYSTRNASLHDLYEPWFIKQQLRRYKKSFDTLRYGGPTFLTESTYLYNKIRFACLVLVRRIKYVKAAKMTWGTQCNYVDFVYLKPTKNRINSRKNITNSAWFLLCTNLSNLSQSFDWILILNENTFALIENMRYLVAPLNSSAQYYLGHSVKFWGVKYNSGQAGYLISNGTLAALRKKLIENSCSSDSVFWNLEDYYLGRALATLNISTSDTRDKLGLATFHGFTLQKLFSPGSITLSNYYKHSTYPALCCSTRSVTFQVQGTSSMFTYLYLFNQLQVFTSGSYGNHLATTPVPDQEIWKAVLREHGRNFTSISPEEYYDFWVDLVSDPNSFSLKLKNGK
ncbi:hypothetical protein RI129_005631 [Pyrocoelia pectoralis]|uniref:Uncharacterized protein n=1 Tax=Pyrocoelia pectoralis TaxID=417401 RepID=A0AAN7ZNK6_9COLE